MEEGSIALRPLIHSLSSYYHLKEDSSHLGKYLWADLKNLYPKCKTQAKLQLMLKAEAKIHKTCS